MIELFVEFMWDGLKYQDRVMFCTWGDQLEAVIPQGSDGCEPMTFPTMKECEESAMWYGTIATANAFQNDAFLYLGDLDNRKSMTGPLKPYCVSKAVA